MKKNNLTAIIYCLTIICLNISFSQNTNQGNGNQQWKINGNIADENHYFGTKNQFPLKFRTNDVERIRITEDGSFGIGTTTPASKLDVNGSAIFRENLQLPNLDYVPIDDKEIIIIDNNGNLKKASHEQMATYLINSLYNSSKNCVGDYLANPTWMNGPKKIYTKCPEVFVGINTNTPRVNLDVIGTIYGQKLRIGNLIPSLNSTDLIAAKAYNVNNNENILNFTASNENGLFKVANDGNVTIGNVANIDAKLKIDVEVFEGLYGKKALVTNFNGSDYAYANIFNVNKNFTKALTIINTTTNKEDIVLYGDGTADTRKVNINSDFPASNNSTLFLTQITH